jgi:hypothetical protein
MPLKELQSEFSRLAWAWHDARVKKNFAEVKRLKANLEEVKSALWQAMTEIFTDLAGFNSLFEALERTAFRLGLPFPDLADPNIHSDSFYFKASIWYGSRAVHLRLMESQKIYDIAVSDPVETPTADGVEYRGETTDFTDVVTVFSKWLMQNYSIEELHTECTWLSTIPQVSIWWWP